jgi:hypothetical protein
MIASIRRTSVLLLGLAAIACSDVQPTTPVPAPAPLAPTAAQPGLIGDVLGAVTKLIIVPAVQRKVALPAPVTVTKTIGSAGGTLSIPAAGVTVVVPQGAVSSSTTFTMTARAGYYVAYDFEPHGIKFAKPLTLTQDLSGTNVTLLQRPFLKLAYYTDPSLLSKAVATVTELISGLLSGNNFSAKINHFSGYVICVGFE